MFSYIFHAILEFVITTIMAIWVVFMFLIFVAWMIGLLVLALYWLNGGMPFWLFFFIIWVSVYIIVKIFEKIF